jgi:hypothetical protein
MPLLAGVFLALLPLPEPELSSIEYWLSPRSVREMVAEVPVSLNMALSRWARISGSA